MEEWNGTPAPLRAKQRRLPVSALLVIIFFIAMGIRLICAVSMKGYLSDQQYFVGWMKTVETYGLGRAYLENGEINYPPLLPGLLGMYGPLLSLLGLKAAAGGLAIKLPVLFIDALAIFGWAKLTKRLPPWRRLVLFVFFALNPAFILDGAVWGQVDMLHSMLMVISVWLLPERPAASGFVYALACLAKFQSVALAPIAAAVLLKISLDRRSPRVLVRYACGFAATFGGTLLFFAAHGSLGAMLRGGYGGAVGLYPSVTLNAMNVWYYLLGTLPNTPDSTLIAPHFTLRMLGLLMLAAAVAIVAAFVLASKLPYRELALKAGLLVQFSFFMLCTEMHERYAMPALVFAVAVLAVDAGWGRIAQLLAFTVFLNMLMVFTSINPYLGMGLVWANVYALACMFAGVCRESGLLNALKARIY